jgi:hypothetical protein
MSSAPTTQIAGLGTSDAPQDYAVVSSQVFELLAVTATFDGSGAAGDFLPCVEIITDSGHSLGTCVAGTVTAGDSAEVTFAPFLKAASSGGGGGLTVQGIQLQTSTAPTTIVPGVLGNHFVESATNFGGPAFAGFFGLFNRINTTGVYAMHAVFQVASGGYTPGQGYQASLTAPSGTLYSQFVTFPTSVPINFFNITCTVVTPPLPYTAGDQFLLDIFTSDTVNVDFQIQTLALIGY